MMLFEGGPHSIRRDTIAYAARVKRDRNVEDRSHLEHGFIC